MLKEKRFQFAFCLCYDVISPFPVLDKLDNNLILPRKSHISVWFYLILCSIYAINFDYCC
jgi:hypothetical protein